MAVTLNPYLHFDGDAADALAFYADVLGGTPTSMTFGEFGVEGEAAQRIMHGHLETDAGMTLMVADFPPGSEPLERGNSVTIALGGDDGDTLHRYWGRLADGGRVDIEMGQQMWGDEFGACTDRFGVSWLVNISASGEN